MITIKVFKMAGSSLVDVDTTDEQYGDRFLNKVNSYNQNDVTVYVDKNLAIDPADLMDKIQDDVAKFKASTNPYRKYADLQTAIQRKI